MHLRPPSNLGSYLNLPYSQFLNDPHGTPSLPDNYPIPLPRGLPACLPSQARTPVSWASRSPWPLFETAFSEEHSRLPSESTDSILLSSPCSPSLYRQTHCSTYEIQKVDIREPDRMLRLREQLRSLARLTRLSCFSTVRAVRAKNSCILFAAGFPGAREEQSHVWSTLPRP